MSMPSDESKFAAASFRLWSQSHRPDFFASLLGRPADKIGIKGERKNPNGRSAAVFKSHVYLIYSGLDSSEPLESHIEALLDKVEPISREIESAKPFAELDIFLGYGSENGQGGAVFSPSLLRRLSALGLDVVFDLHPPESFVQDS